MPAEQQYFAQNPGSESNPTSFSLKWREREYTFLTDSGVFSKGALDYGTRALLEALPDGIIGRVLDLGCGWGPVGVLLGAQHPDATIVMADVNERAVMLAAENARRNQVKAQAIQSDGFNNITGQFDVIALNPPIRAGKETVYRLFSEAADHLTPGGALYVVMRKQQGAPSALKFLAGVYSQVETLSITGGYRVIKCMEGKAQHV